MSGTKIIKDGYQQRFDVGRIIDDVVNMYGQLKSAYASIGIDLKRSDEHPPEEVKSTSKAIRLRNSGNEKFKSGNDNKALRLYSKSIAHAIEGSEEKMLAYANRSAVLIRMDKYAPCLYDINRALQGNYPEHLKQKLLDRKVQCLALMESNKKLSRVDVDATDPIDLTDPDIDREWRELLTSRILLFQMRRRKSKLPAMKGGEDIWWRRRTSIQVYCIHFQRC